MANCFERAWRRRFERAAEKYDRDHAVSGWSEEGLRRRLATFVECFEAAALPPGRMVLDLGCGAGTYSAWLAACGHRVVALDYSTGALRVASERLRRAGVSLLAGEAYHLPLAAAAFEVVVCIAVFQTLDRPRECLAEIRRVLVPGGRLFLMTLNARHVATRVARMVRRRRAGYEDLRRYAPEVLRRRLNRARLRVQHIAPVYLMPDRAMGLSSMLERCGLYRGLTRLGTLPMPAAHATLLVARAE